jgi:putative oxidoreductase
VAATLIAHRFWDVPVDQQAMQSIQFMKNVAIIGGLLSLVAAGGGRFSVAALLRRPRF